MAFPQNGSIRYDETWKALAEMHLPSGRGRPCMDIVAQRFRENLNKHGISLNDRSVKMRWIKFCQRANPVANGGAGQAISSQEVKLDRNITIEKPVFDLSNPFENLSQYMFDKSAQTWVNWFKPLKATQEGEIWVVSAPSGFHARYVETNFGDVLRGYLGRVEYRTL